MGQHAVLRNTGPNSRPNRTRAREESSHKGGGPEGSKGSRGKAQNQAGRTRKGQTGAECTRKEATHPLRVYAPVNE
jgi:hypothetical protein